MWSMILHRIDIKFGRCSLIEAALWFQKHKKPLWCGPYCGIGFQVIVITVWSTILQGIIIKCDLWYCRELWSCTISEIAKNCNKIRLIYPNCGHIVVEEASKTLMTWPNYGFKPFIWNPSKGLLQFWWFKKWIDVSHYVSNSFTLFWGEFMYL
jgi:hypothetical protein